MPFGWVLLDLLAMKIKLRCIRSTVLNTLPFWNCKDPDQDQIEKQDPDPYQMGVDPQHCNWLAEIMYENGLKN
jgi:hypothetical protein